MSFSVRDDASGLEYNGTSLNTLFAQRRNLFRPSFLGMVRDILRFNREAPLLLDAAPATNCRSANTSAAGATAAPFASTTSCRWAPRSGPPMPAACSIFRRGSSCASCTTTGC